MQEDDVWAVLANSVHELWNRIHHEAVSEVREKGLAKLEEDDAQEY